MDKEQAKAELKSRLANYITETRGVDASKKVFKCINPAHEDKHPSMGIKGDNCHCFACGATYDIIDLLAIDLGLDASKDFYKVLQAGCERYNIPYENGCREQQGKGWQRNRKPSPKLSNPSPAPTDNMAYYKACAEKLAGCGYLQARGISIETGKRFMLGYDTNFRTKAQEGEKAGSYITWAGLIIPTGKYSYVIRNTDNSASGKDRYRKRGESQLFNLKAVEAGRPVFVVEGELDALSIEEAGYKAIGLGSIDNIDKLVSHFELVRPAGVLVLALDNDSRGQEAQAKLKDKLAYLQLKLYEANIAGSYKDANEHLIADRAGFIKTLQQAEQIEQATLEAVKDAEQEAYRQSFTGNRLDKFLENIHDKGMYNPISTGFHSLDDVLEGGLYAGLYVVGAISSLGKTTLCLQIADQIAKHNIAELEEWQAKYGEQDLFNRQPAPAKPVPRDVIIFSLEMSEDEIIAKSLSRETMIASVEAKGDASLAKTTRGILTGQRWEHYTDEETALIYTAVDVYHNYAQHIKVVEGMGDVGVQQIREIVQRHTAITGNAPVVIVDYVQILAPVKEGGTDKQNTDKAVLELKKLSRDYRIPVIAISSFNRENYTEPVNMASYKESGCLEYSSDILLGLQYAGMDYQEGETPKDKNRVARIKKLVELNTEQGRAGKQQELQLKVLKNRNGTRGAVYLDFTPMFNNFDERPLFTGGARLAGAVASGGAGMEAFGEVIDEEQASWENAKEL